MLVPFGANVDAPSTSAIEATARHFSASRLRSTSCSLGRDWETQGRRPGRRSVPPPQRKAGREVILHVVGVPLPGLSPMSHLCQRARRARQATRWSIAQRCSTCCLPAMFSLRRRGAEAYGMSFCEASAWAMPSLTTMVGGIPTIVENGVTGWTLSPEADPAAYAEKLVEMTADADRYRSMAWRARHDYEARLNSLRVHGSALWLIIRAGLRMTIPSKSSLTSPVKIA